MRRIVQPSKISFHRFVSVSLALGIVIFMIGLSVEPRLYAEALLSGLLAWGTAVLPALFPYFVLTKLLSRLGCVPLLGQALTPATRRLYRTGGFGGYIALISFMSGYPVGARMLLDFSRAGTLDKDEATRIATFSSTSGPMFILGTLSAVFGSHKITLLLFFTHIAGALLNGLIYRKYGKPPAEKPIALTPQNDDAVYSSLLSVLTVGGYIAFFFVLTAFLTRIGALAPFNAFFEMLCGALSLPAGFGSAITKGLLELTGGCLGLSEFAAAYPGAVATAAGALLSFGGLCINCQGISFLRPAGVKIPIFILSKFTQMLITLSLTLVFSLLIF